MKTYAQTFLLGALASLFCCLPGIEAPASLSYKDTFKVAIINAFRSGISSLRGPK